MDDAERTTIEAVVAGAVEVAISGTVLHVLFFVPQTPTMTFVSILQAHVGVAILAAIPEA